MNWNWITTYTGKRFDLEHPTPEMIDIEDIAHALSNICRWTGHTLYHYSVAQHSVNVSLMFDQRDDALWGLLHDAPEAYLGDVSQPLKALLPYYRKLESNVMDVICEKFELPRTKPYPLAQIDERVLFEEARLVLADSSWLQEEPTASLVAKNPIEPLAADHFSAMDPADAELLFGQRFYELTGIW